MSVTRDWLEKLYGRSPGYFTVVVFRNGKPAIVRAYDKDTLDQAAQSIEQTKSGDVYVSCATFGSQPDIKNRGSDNDTVSIAGLWADIDIDGPGHKPDPNRKPLPKDLKDAERLLDTLPEPTYIIHSGGGLQAWWLFDSPWQYSDVQEARAVVADWQRLLSKKADDLGFSIDNVGDLARLLRPPGTVNLKTGEPREVKVYKSTDTVYQFVELANLGIPPEPRTQAEIIDESGLGSWEEILEPHGWTPIRQRDKDKATEWYRPGKSSGTISAVTDPYGIPVLVVFSSNAGLPVGPGQRLTKFRVWAHLNYNGNLDEAKAALASKKRNDDESLIARAEKYSVSRINWTNFWTEVPDEIDWFAEPLIEKGRQIALFSEAKAGKSLLMLEIVARLTTGMGIFDKESREPINVLYLDKENMKVDIRDRLVDMGFGPETDFSRLHYHTFPDLPYLDKPEGGLDVLGLAIAYGAELVVIDTLSRVVQGLENDNDTYHEFYKHTGVWLKQRGIGLVRLDHSGKDAAKGMRGASSKTTDVDAVWQLQMEKETGSVRLTRTHTRTNHGADRISFMRAENPLRHLPIDVVDGQSKDPIDLCMVAMDQAGIPDNDAVNAAYNKFKDNPLRDKKWTQETIRCAQQRRQTK